MNRRVFVAMLACVPWLRPAKAQAAPLVLADADLLSTADCVVWAREFCRITGFKDEDWARAWFAHAIMAGWQEGHRRYAARIAPKQANEWRPSEALFAFCGWLTSRDKPVTFSACHNAAPAVELLTEFIERHNLSDLRDGWEKAIVPEARTGG